MSDQKDFIRAEALRHRQALQVDPAGIGAGGGGHCGQGTDGKDAVALDRQRLGFGKMGIDRQDRAAMKQRDTGIGGGQGGASCGGGKARTAGIRHR